MSVELSPNAMAGLNLPGVGSLELADPPVDETTPLPSASSFEQVTQNLLKLGSVYLERFSSPSVDFDSFQPSHSNLTADASLAIEKQSILPLHAVQHLHQACQRVFGTVAPETLKFEFLEEFGPSRSSCFIHV